MLMPAFLCLGSNCADAENMLEKARKGIASLENVGIVAQSRVYVTEPQEFREQPWFHNQVLKIETEDCGRPEIFLRKLLDLETALGRVRSPNPELRFGPRVIDIDLLLYGDKISHNPECELPHPRMLNRAFVLVPLLEIAPHLAIAGKSIASHLDRLSWRLDYPQICQRH